MDGITSPSFRWTTVTSDNAVLDHLFQLYFAWVHPVHTLFSEGRFVDSYKRQSVDFCSSTLVNAICAMACCLHTATDGEVIDCDSLATKFSNAVRSSIDIEDNSITTVQVFAVMFLVDSACADGLRASSYLNLAARGLSTVSALHVDGFADVCWITSQGIRNLSVSVDSPPSSSSALTS